MEWSEGDVTLDGVRIHCYRRGSGRPVVVAHGFSDNGKCWERVATVLQDRYEVIAYDARHHGLSDAPRDGAPGEGNDLVALVEALGLERPALMGHSMGGATVAQAAGLRPELFRCAILEDPPWRDGEAPAPAREVPNWQKYSFEQVVEYGKQLAPQWHDDEFPAWANAKLQFRLPPNWAERRAASLGGWRERVQAIGVPTMLMRGGSVERGRIVDDAVAAEARQLNPLIDCVCFAQAGHNIRREAFAPFVAAVRAFLARH